MAKVNVNRATREELVEAAGLRPWMAEAVLRLRDEHGGRIADLEALKEIKGVGEATVDHLREVLVAGKRPDEGAAAAPKKDEETVARKDAEVTALAARSGGADGARKGDDVAREGAGVTAVAAKSGTDTARKGDDIAAFAAKSGGAEENAEATATVAKAGGTDTARKDAEVTAFAARSGGAEAARRGDDVAQEGAGVTAMAAKAGADTAQKGAEVAAFAARSGAEAERRAAERSSEAASDLGGLFVGLVGEQARHNVETLRALAKARTFREAADVQGAYYRASVERATRGTTRYVEVVSELAAGMVTFGRGEAREAA